MTTVAVLGSTGSIGTQTLDVVRAEPDRYRGVALGAASSVDRLVEQAEEFRPDVVAIGEARHASELRRRVPAGHRGRGRRRRAGRAVAVAADMVVNGVVGFAGLPVTLATLEAGRRLALANKESLIAAGPVVQRARRTPGAELVPVDSEHSAIHQCLHANPGGDPCGVGRHRAHRQRRALPGPEPSRAGRGHRRRRPGPSDLADGARRSPIDSSTLMNKGLEVIEAHELFGVDYDRIEVVVHPQSVVHSMVEFTDGATVAQLSMPDMRLPIGYALAYPERSASPFGRIDWAGLARLDFEPPDLERLPVPRPGLRGRDAGGTAPAWLNAANEVAVAAFLDGRIPWLAIPDVLKAALARHDGARQTSVDAVIDADRQARLEAGRIIDKRASAA